MGLRLIFVFLVAGLLVAQKIPPATFNGTIHAVSGKQITIENEDGNLLDFEINRKTRLVRGDTQISASDLVNGEAVTIEARQEMGRFLVAVSVTAHPKAKD
jgi:hypothetical protein